MLALDAIRVTIAKLVTDRFFDHLRPLVPAEANGAAH